MPETMPTVIFSRHARRRMKLYAISEEDVVRVLKEGFREGYGPDRFTHLHTMPGWKYPLKVIVKKCMDTCTVITAYPLKRGGNQT